MPASSGFNKSIIEICAICFGSETQKKDTTAFCEWDNWFGSLASWIHLVAENTENKA